MNIHARVAQAAIRRTKLKCTRSPPLVPQPDRASSRIQVLSTLQISGPVSSPSARAASDGLVQVRHGCRAGRAAGAVCRLGLFTDNCVPGRPEHRRRLGTNFPLPPRADLDDVIAFDTRRAAGDGCRRDQTRRANGRLTDRSGRRWGPRVVKISLEAARAQCLRSVYCLACTNCLTDHGPGGVRRRCVPEERFLVTEGQRWKELSDCRSDRHGFHRFHCRPRRGVISLFCHPRKSDALAVAGLEIILGGGGAKVNSRGSQMLPDRLPGGELTAAQRAAGIDKLEQKEPLAFAILATRLLGSEPSNVPVRHRRAAGQ